MGALIIIGIIILIVVNIIKNNSPEAKEKRELEKEQEREKQAEADLQIGSSLQAWALGDSVVNALSNQKSDLLKFLRQQGAYMVLCVTSEEFYFELKNYSDDSNKQIKYDDRGNPLPPEKRIIRGRAFRDLDWENLPNKYMVSALRKYLLERIDELPNFTVKHFGENNSIFYTPQKSAW